MPTTLHSQVLRLLLSVGILISSVPVFALTQADLQKDLQYYRSTADRKNLSPNDRLAILYRLRDKYAGQAVSTASLESSIDIQEKLRAAQKESNRRAGAAKPKQAKPPARPKAAPAYVPPPVPVDEDAAPRLLDVRQSASGGQFTITFVMSKSVAPQAVRMTDPQKPDYLALQVDLPGAENGLPASKKNRITPAGPVKSFRLSEEDGMLQAEIELEKVLPTRVSRDDKTVRVQIPWKAPAAEAPSVSAPATDDDYVIQTGDILNVQVSPATELSREVAVQPDGTMVFPLAGTLTVRGLTVGEMERALTQALKPYVAKPLVEVSIKQFSNRNVFFMGSVARPGPMTYKTGLGLIGAISESGGFLDDANRAGVKVYRGKGQDRKTLEVNVEKILAQGDLSKDFPLQAGDIVEVPRGINTISIIGQVLKPGTLPYKPNITLFELISEVGGLSVGANAKKVRIFRENGETRKTIKVNLARIMEGHPEEDVPMKVGDIVVVPQRSLYSSTNAMSSILLPWLSLLGVAIALTVALA